VTTGVVPALPEVTPEFRRRLLEAMAAAIRERGFRESTIADVVRHARTSRRTFYEHFATKQDCYVALLRESNAEMIVSIAAITLSWIREIPSLGEGARHLQRDFLEAFIALIQNLTDNPELRAAGVPPVSRQVAILLLGGLRELMATTVEDGGAIGDITEVAVEATMALLGPGDTSASATGSSS
jgi:AcrR family transcriptional regulator